MKKFLASKPLLEASSLIHPLLFAIFPIVFLYAHNIGETSVRDVLVPLLFSVSGALLSWFFLSLLLKNTLKAGLATTIFALLFFSYGRFYDLLGNWNVTVARHAYLLPAALLLWGYCVYFIKMARTDFGTLSKLLNVVAVALISVNLAGIALHNIRVPRPASGSHLEQQNVAAARTNPGEPGTMPDIYYIILDEYAHPDTMLDYYDYDNSFFTDELAENGFFIASNSRTAASWSHRSIASSLNMEYVPRTEPDEVVYQKIANSKVADHLKSVGYTYIYFGSWYGQGAYEVDADVSYNFYQSSGTNAVIGEFPRILWNTTMAQPFYDYLTGDIYAGHYRSALIDTIKSLKTMPDVQGPKFVFAHILCPHPPFLFGPAGEYIDPIEQFNFEDERFYLGQYKFITREIEEVVAALLKKSDSDPIIILQSDHGLRAVNPGIHVGPNEWQRVLNAYHLPGNGSQDLYDSISPVNSFRVILNRYFGADYPLLEDPEPAQIE